MLTGIADSVKKGPKRLFLALFLYVFLAFLRLLLRLKYKSETKYGSIIFHISGQRERIRKITFLARINGIMTKQTGIRLSFCLRKSY